MGVHLYGTYLLGNVDNNLYALQDNPEAYEKFIQLTRAYDTLKDPILRKQYDSHGEEGVDIASKKGTYHSWSYYANNFGIYDDDPWIVTLDENDYRKHHTLYVL